MRLTLLDEENKTQPPSDCRPVATRNLRFFGDPDVPVTELME